MFAFHSRLCYDKYFKKFFQLLTKTFIRCRWHNKHAQLENILSIFCGNFTTYEKQNKQACCLLISSFSVRYNCPVNPLLFIKTILKLSLLSFWLTKECVGGPAVVRHVHLHFCSMLRCVNDAYWIYRENSLELIELSSMNKVSLV